MKRLLSLFLITSLAASLCSCIPQKESIEPADNTTTAAATNAPTATSAADTTTAPPLADSENETSVKLTYWLPLVDASMVTSNEEVSAYKILQKTTGIDLEFLHPPTGQTAEQFNLMIASDDLPDMIKYNWAAYPGGVEAAVQGNILITLNNIINEKMPNYRAFLDRFPEVEKMAMTDSGLHTVFPGIYTTTPADSEMHQGLGGRIPFYETYLGMCVRMDWLELLDMDMPVTIDDWFTMLTAFRDKLGAAAPLSITKDFLQTSGVFYSAFNLCSGFYEDDGIVKYGPYETAYKEYLKVMNRLYKEKLLDSDFAILDNAAFTAKVMTSQTGAWAGYSSTHLGVLYDQIHTEDPNAAFYPIGVKNPVLYNGQKLKYRQADYPVLFSVATGITTSCENVDAAAQLIDWGYTEEGDFALNWGDPEDCSVEIIDGWPAWVDSVKNNPDYTSAQMSKLYGAFNGPFAIDHWSRLLNKLGDTTPESINALDTWENENGTSPSTLPPISLLPEQTGEYANLFADIDTYTSEMYTKFIMGEESLDNYDEYIKNLEKMGINDVLSMQQAALDRYYLR